MTLSNGSSSGTEVVHRTKATLATSAVQQSKALVSYIIHPTSRSWILRVNISSQLKVAIERFRKETYRVFGVLEIRLSGKYTGEPREYLAGNGKGKYTVADIGTWAWVKNWERSGYTKEDMQEFPHLLQWIERIAERPAVKVGTGEKYANK